MAEPAATATPAIILREYGGTECLQPGSAPLPAPGPGEIQIRHEAVGVNFHDIYVCSGHYRTLSLPGIPGLEGAGTIVSVGPGVERFAIGDRVAYVSSAYGGYAESRNLAADLAVRVPDAVDLRVAGAMFLKGLTATTLLHFATRPRTGDTILVHAAAGGVGRLLVQWAVHLGLRVIGTAGSADKAAAAQRYGCTETILYREENFATRALELTDGRGVDIVFDAVGCDTFDQSLASLAALGHLVNYGQASGPIPPFDIARLASKGLTLSRPAYAHYVRTPDELRSVAGLFFDALAGGILAPETGVAFPLASAADAHAALERRASGPFVLIP